jgi:hypothetical protein
MNDIRFDRSLARDLREQENRIRGVAAHGFNDPWSTVSHSDFEGAETVTLAMEDDTSHVPSLDDLRRLSERIRSASVWTRERS